MAALRGRSLDLRAGREEGSVDDGGCDAVLAGFLFCASFSVMLNSSFCGVRASSAFPDDACSCALSNCLPPAIDVSGMPALRGGGGGSEGRSCTRCAVAVACGR